VITPDYVWDVARVRFGKEQWHEEAFNDPIEAVIDALEAIRNNPDDIWDRIVLARADAADALTGEFVWLFAWSMEIPKEWQ